MPIRTDEWTEWEDQCRRQLERPLEHRMLYGWYRQRALPGMELPREPYRSFDTMEEYRAWCERTYPEYCGYGRTKL